MFTHSFITPTFSFVTNFKDLIKKVILILNNFEGDRECFYDNIASKPVTKIFANFLRCFIFKNASRKTDELTNELK